MSTAEGVKLELHELTRGPAACPALTLRYSGDWGLRQLRSPSASTRRRAPEPAEGAHSALGGRDDAELNYIIPNTGMTPVEFIR